MMQVMCPADEAGPIYRCQSLRAARQSTEREASHACEDRQQHQKDVVASTA
jgi:hypothetical protein